MLLYPLSGSTMSRHDQRAAHCLPGRAGDHWGPLWAGSCAHPCSNPNFQGKLLHKAQTCAGKQLLPQLRAACMSHPTKWLTELNAGPADLVAVIGANWSKIAWWAPGI